MYQSKNADGFELIIAEIGDARKDSRIMIPWK